MQVIGCGDLSIIRIMLLGLLLGAAAAGAAPPPAEQVQRVGKYGAPRSFKFEGCQAFPAADVAAALERNLDVQLRSSPSAPLGAYLNVVRDAIRAGYMAEGYLLAQVTAVKDAKLDAVVVTVSEGARFTCGAIRVNGAKTLPVEKMIAKLTSERPVGVFPEDFSVRQGVFRLGVDNKLNDPERPNWRPGEPVRGHPWGIQKLRDAIRRSCCELGFFETWFELRVSTDAPDAALEITIRDEGPRAVLDAVDVTGARKNGNERVAKYLGLELGKPLDLSRLREVQQKLWDSGRFTAHTVYAEPRRLDASRMRMRVELTEYEDAPLLDAPFSDAERAALAFRQWVLGTRHLQEDLAANWDHPVGRFGLALGDGRGLAARLLRSAGGERLDLGIFVTGSAVGLCAPGAGRVWVSGPPPAHFHTGLFFGPSREPTQDRPLDFNVYWGFRTRRRPDLRPMELRAALAPVAFIRLVHTPGHTSELRDGVLTVAGPEISKLAVNAATGRLLELQLGDPELAASVFAKKDALAEMVASMQAGAANDYDAAAPVGSLLRFLVTEALRSGYAPGSGDLPKERRDAAAAAAAKLLAGDALAPLERQAASLAGAFDDEAFQVPVPQVAERASPQAMLAAFALAVVDDTFPRGSWPWTLSRLGVLITRGEFHGATDEVSRLMASEEIGPLGYLAAAELLARVNPQMSRPFARRGLQRLGLDGFERDVDQLLHEGFAPFEVLGRVAGNLRTLTPQDVEALSAALPEAGVVVLRRLSEDLRARPDAPPRELLRAALRDAWAAGLEQTVKAQLLTLQAPAPVTR